MGCAVELPWLTSLLPAANLKLTPMQTAIVPPPMAYCTLALPCPVLEVSFEPVPSNAPFRRACALLADGSIALLSLRLAEPTDHSVRDGGAAASSWKLVSAAALLEEDVVARYVLGGSL